VANSNEGRAAGCLPGRVPFVVLKPCGARCSWTDESGLCRSDKYRHPDHVSTQKVEMACSGSCAAQGEAFAVPERDESPPRLLAFLGPLRASEGISNSCGDSRNVGRNGCAFTSMAGFTAE
jgi:hypothetical protein